jgi:hypothetical protein
MAHKARPPARFSRLLGPLGNHKTENKNQKEKPFTQNSLQNHRTEPIRSETNQTSSAAGSGR